MKARGMSFFLLLLINFNLFAGTNSQLESQRAGFLKAEKLIQSQSWAEYEAIKESLATYPLFPYLEYEVLVKKVHKSRYNPENSVSYEQIEAFAKKYPTLPLLNRLLYKS